MKYRLMDLLICPACQQRLTLNVLAETAAAGVPGPERRPCSTCFFPRRAQGSCTECRSREVLDGILACSCGRRFPVIDAVPVMLLRSGPYMAALREKYPDAFSGPAQAVAEDAGGGGGAYARTRQRFGFEWSRYPACFEEEEEAIFLEETQVEPRQFSGRLILDAGCGMGRFTRIAGRLGGEVVGIDLSDSVRKARRVTEHLPSVHIVQADILHLPFCDNTFDIAYSLGVLHHTPDTRRSFQALVRKVKEGGLVSVWVYGTAGRYAGFVTNPLRPDRARFIQGPVMFRLYWMLVAVRERFSNALRALTVRCPHAALYLLCYLLVGMGKIPLLKYFTFSAHADRRVRLLENFDWLSPPFQHHHTKEEVRGWFQEQNIEVHGMLEHGFIPKVGLLGRRGREP